MTWSTPLLILIYNLRLGINGLLVTSSREEKKELLAIINSIYNSQHYGYNNLLENLERVLQVQPATPTLPRRMLMVSKIVKAMDCRQLRKY